MKKITGYKPLRMKPLVLALAGAATFSFATPAMALTFVEDVLLYPLVTNGFAAVTTAITTSTTTIIQMMRTMMAANDSSAMKVASVVNSSSDNIIQRNGDYQKLQQGADIERSLQQPIDPCANAGMGFANPGARTFRPGGGFGGNIMNTRFKGASGGFDTGSAQLNDSLDIADGNKPAPSPEIQAMKAQQGGCEAYAAGARAQACQAAGIPAGAGKYPNADIKASSLFDGAQIKDESGKISLTMNSEQISAAKAFMRNLTNPITLRDLTASESKTDAGRQYLAMRDAHAAKIDMANFASNEWLSNEAPYKENVAVIEAMLEGNGAAAAYVQANVNNFGPKGGNWKSDGISNHAMLTIEANRRANNPAWIAEIGQAADPLTLQREQLVISAHTNYLLTKILFSQDKHRMQTGAISQATTERDFMPDLLAAHRKATTSAK